MFADAVNDVQTDPRKAMVDFVETTGCPRWIPHKETVSDGWCKDGVATKNYQGNCRIMTSEKHGKDSRMWMVDAVPAAGCPQRPPAPRDHGRRWQQQQLPPVRVHGRRLLEMLSLSANFLVNTTISVFDGKRGQVIYENYDRGQGDAHPPATARSNNPEAGFTNLILTGPHKAISAEGESFAIKLESDGANKIWEFNICSEADDDGVVESVIPTDDGKILVTYAVLSNAVEATVHANLVCFAAQTHVYGKITAHILGFDDEDNVLLLSRPARDPAQLIPSSSAFIVPLSRSIIAVPISSYIEVVVDIYATSIREDTAPTRFHGNLRFPSGEHTMGIHTAMGDLAISVDVTH